jgi:hypothetical protein
MFKKIKFAGNFKSLLLVLVPYFAPFVAQAQPQGKNVYQIIGYVQTELIDPLITFFMILASVLFIWGVIEFLFIGASNEEAKSKGKKHMVWGLVGLFIMISVNLIMAVITAFFLSVP